MSAGPPKNLAWQAFVPFLFRTNFRAQWRYAPTGACPRGATDSWAKRESYVVHFDPCVLVTWVKEIRRLCAQASTVTGELLGNSGNGCKVMVLVG